MKTLTYNRLGKLGYYEYAVRLRERFGGRGVPLTDEVARFCDDLEWCPNGAMIVATSGLPGGRQAFDKWCKADARLSLNMGLQSDRGRRWRLVAKHIRRFHGIKGRAPKSA